VPSDHSFNTQPIPFLKCLRKTFQYSTDTLHHYSGWQIPQNDSHHSMLRHIDASPHPNKKRSLLVYWCLAFFRTNGSRFVWSIPETRKVYVFDWIWFRPLSFFSAFSSFFLGGISSSFLYGEPVITHAGPLFLPLRPPDLRTCEVGEISSG
jgi:hypothetical protein